MGNQRPVFTRIINRSERSSYWKCIFFTFGQFCVNETFMGSSINLSLMDNK